MEDLERRDLQAISENTDITEKELQSILEETIYPKQDSWGKFIKIVLLTLGIGFLAAGIVFFFAYNWQDLNKFLKLGIVQGLVVITVLLAMFLKIEKLYKDIIITGSTLLVGVMFAVFGQIYQTGANAYDFFLAWTVFISLWVFISNFPPLWIVYLGLCNLTIYLYWDQVARDWDFIYLSSGLFVLNGSILLVSTWIKSKGKGNIPTYFTNLLAISAAICSIYSNLYWILEDRTQDTIIIVAATMLFYGLGLWYAIRENSVFYMGLIPLSMVIILSGAILKISEEDYVFLGLSIFIIVSVSLIIWNLINMQRRKSHGQ